MKLAKTVCAAASTVALSIGFLSLSGAAYAAGAQCGQPYRILPGDTLSNIAQDVYGSARDFQIIYSANSGVIGSNPSMIEVGLEIDIPCIGGAVEASVADASVIKIAKTTKALPAPDKRAIRVVVGSNWAPFTDEDSEQGGMITEIANVALAQSSSKPEYKIDFIRDWSAHLNPLIADHAYDFSLVWFRPNCDYIALLSEDSQFRCNNLDWSEPMFEQIFGYYTRADEDPLTSYDQLRGRHVCRPAGYATFMLEEKGLNVDTIKLSRPTAPEECFNGLAEGRYDAVALAVDTSEGVITEQGLKEKLQYNEALSQVLTLHAVIAKTNPNAKEYLAVLDDGINKVKDSGEWFKIVRRHLTAHRALTQ